jgi:ribosomal protein S18 acetylase RimI-like enzyme
MTLRIRPIDQAEKFEWCKLFQSYAGFYNVDLPSQAESQAWAWIHDDDEDFWCDVAVTEQGDFAGFVQYQLMHRSLSGEKVCYLSDLYVDPEVRGGGFGRALIDHVFNVARDKQWSNVRWLTQEGNERARKIYDHYSPRSEFVLYSVPVNP